MIVLIQRCIDIKLLDRVNGSQIYIFVKFRLLTDKKNEFKLVRIYGEIKKYKGDTDMLWYDKHRKKLYIKEELIYREITLRPKEYGIWELLYNFNDQPTSRQLMCDEVWGGRYVTDFTINQTINQLRKKIGPLGKDVIITYPRKGYAINADLVSVCPANNDAMPDHEKDAMTVDVDSSICPCAKSPMDDVLITAIPAENPKLSESKIMTGELTEHNKDHNRMKKFFSKIFQLLFR